MLKNFRHKASSRKPSVTFTEFNQPPEAGKLFIHSGKIAKSVKGMEKASAYENIANTGFRICPPADITTTFPTMGIVHENETSTSVAAIKKIPRVPPFSA